MRQFKTESRLNKIKNVVSSRQFDLEVVLEEVHDPHNVSAILRTCDAVGVQNVSLIYNINKFPRISRVSSASAKKWVDVKHYESIEKCYEEYHISGFKIYATTLNSNSKSIYDVDFTKKSAIVMGNEHFGVTANAAELADETIYIPMKGMIQSLNVSVAAAVVLYEAFRQRMSKKMYEYSSLNQNKIEELIDEWCNK
jgi:tRNA (guanosine-2'-O-)-methyltransferase